MTTRAHEILSLLQKGDLLPLADRFGIRLTDRKSQEAIVADLIGAKGVTLAQLLQALPRATLKELCRQRGLDDSGREKLLIVTRLLGGEGLLTAPAVTSPLKQFTLDLGERNDVDVDVENKGTGTGEVPIELKGNTTYGEATKLKNAAVVAQCFVQMGHEVDLPVIAYYGTGRLWV
jgi:hypothetical protein